MITTTRALLTALWKHSAQDISLLLNNLRSQHTNLITTGKLDDDPNKDNTQSPLTHALHNLPQTLNLHSSQYDIANSRPTLTRYARYARAVTVCPIITIEIPGTLRMCEYCDLLRHILTKTPIITIQYAPCQLSISKPLSPVLDVFYTPSSTKHTFSQRWDEI